MRKNLHLILYMIRKMIRKRVLPHYLSVIRPVSKLRRQTRSGERFYQYCLRFRELNYAMEREFRDMKGEISDILQDLVIIPLDFSYPICLARRNDLYEKTSVQTFRKCCFKRVVE